MNVLSIMLEAIESLSSNKMRSGLTILGIVIGVASVIAMLSLGSGTEASITQEIANIGTNLLYVSSGGDAANPEPLTLKDAEALLKPSAAPAVANVAPTMQSQTTVSVAGESTKTSLVGITPDFFLVQNAPLAEGSSITQAHLESYAAVALLGADVAEALFDTQTGLIGKSVRIGNQPFKVIGVLEGQGGNNLGSSDNRILVPLTTAQVRLVQRSTSDQVDMIYVQAKSSEDVPAAIEQVSQILRSRHRRNLGQDDFSIVSTQSFLDMASTITGTITAFLGGIAGVSLLVGGIGIMNIMLVTVVERTREIGLRKAMGARKNDIRLQFLVESSFLSLGGGVIGILLGWGIALLVGQIATMGGVAIQPVVEPGVILLATLFSAAVGLFFGLYPANRAAGLQPVEALRYE
jgi:putative ABC transport system permease protein